MSSIEMRSSGAPAFDDAMPERLSAASAPARAHAATSEVVVTGAAAVFLPSTKRLPRFLSERLSMTRTSETAAQLAAVGNSPGAAIILYASGTDTGATDDGVEHAIVMTANKRTALRINSPL